MNKQTEDLEKDIVSFEQAIELTTLGFDKQTLCGYDIADRQLYLCQVDEDGVYMPEKDISAPTKSQVFRWFREKYEFFQEVSPMKVFASDKTGHRYIWCIYDIDQIVVESDTEILGYYSYEEAENACIDKLIELAK